MILRAHNKSNAASAAASLAPPPFAGGGPSGSGRTTFAAGRFWEVGATSCPICGVVQASVGYTCGQRPSPTDEQVSSHAEAVEVWLELAAAGFDELLATFWQTHTHDGEPAGVGLQRSVPLGDVLSHDPNGKRYCINSAALDLADAIG